MDGLPIPRAGQPAAVVAVPACDEEGWIERCLIALDRQQGAVPTGVLVLVNNSTDRTSLLIRRLLPSLGVPVRVIEHEFPSAERSAGHARCLAMEQAARLLPPDGILLCTDADGQVAPDWLAANLFHLRSADAVAGRAVIDPVDAALIPAALHADDARECAYATLLDEIDSILDPDPADPWPRHTEHSGASIGVTLDAFRRAGGVPAVAVGEDRAFFAALRRIDARIRHANDVTVTVSGRVEGRASGGMADTIRRRMVAQDVFLDDALEPVADRVRRARLRAAVRRTYKQGVVPPRLRPALGCDAAVLAMALQQSSFGRAWEMLEAHAPRLNRHPVPVASVQQQTTAALQVLRLLKSSPGRRARQDRAAPSVSLAAGTSRMAV